jgi:hypothetical protein
VITTPQLIDSLAGGLRAAPQGFVVRRLALGLCLGAAIALAITLYAWGVRLDIAIAMQSSSFWLKLAYPGGLALLGFAAILRLSRPDGHIAPATWIGLALVILVMSGLAAAEFWRAPASAYRYLVMGSTSAVCPWLIALLAVPIMGITFWMLRAMAPTQLTLAGAVAGLTAGASAALVYAFSCDESALPFVLIWYGLGMALPTAAGAMLGRLALRW